MSGIGPRLKAERKRLALSAEKFGGACGVAENAQYNYEKGVRSPDAEYLARAVLAGVDVLYVLTGQRSTALLSAEQQQLLDAFQAADPVLRAGALAALTSRSALSGGARLTFEGEVGAAVAGDATFNAPVTAKKARKK